MECIYFNGLVTLFIYWEIPAIASVFLIWSSRTETSFKAGMRYLIIQVGSGVLLLAGAIIHFHKTGSIAFDKMNLSGLGPILIFIGMNRPKLLMPMTASIKSLPPLTTLDRLNSKLNLH